MRKKNNIINTDQVIYYALHGGVAGGNRKTEHDCFEKNFSTRETRVTRSWSSVVDLLTTYFVH